MASIFPELNGWALRYSNDIRKQTIWHPTYFRPFEYQTNWIFKSPLYYPLRSTFNKNLNKKCLVIAVTCLGRLVFLPWCSRVWFLRLRHSVCCERCSSRSARPRPSCSSCSNERQESFWSQRFPQQAYCWWQRFCRCCLWSVGGRYRLPQQCCCPFGQQLFCFSLLKYKM